MKRAIASAVLATAATLFAAGCQNGGGPTDDEIITETLSTWAEGMKAKNVEAVLGVISENFTNPNATDKAAMGEWLESIIEQGWLDGLELTMEDAERQREDGAAEVYVYPIDAESNAGVGTIGITLTKEGRKWLITGMDVET